MAPAAVSLTSYQPISGRVARRVAVPSASAISSAPRHTPSIGCAGLQRRGEEPLLGHQPWVLFVLRRVGVAAEAEYSVVGLNRVGRLGRVRRMPCIDLGAACARAGRGRPLGLHLAGGRSSVRASGPRTIGERIFRRRHAAPAAVAPRPPDFHFCPLKWQLPLVTVGLGRQTCSEVHSHDQRPPQHKSECDNRRVCVRPAGVLPRRRPLPAAVPHSVSSLRGVRAETRRT